jgi:NAD(P)H-hydrate repair Nnr-like enzyme with NAD(P)H-hydrate epimerase domain
MAKEDKLSPDCLMQYRIANKTGACRIQDYGNGKDIHSAVVVDALLGTGMNKPVTSPLADVIAFLNRSDAFWLFPLISPQAYLQMMDRLEV